MRKRIKSVRTFKTVIHKKKKMAQKFKFFHHYKTHHCKKVFFFFCIVNFLNVIAYTQYYY